MTRKSRREIERALDELARDVSDTSSVDVREGVPAEWVTYDADVPDDVITAYEVVDNDGDPIKNLYHHTDGTYTEEPVDCAGGDT